MIYMVGQLVKWLKNVDGFDVMSISEKCLIGYLLKVDLEYFDKLHELHNVYPLAPEKRVVSSNLSKYWKKFADKYDIKVGDVKKLVPNLGNKLCTTSLPKSSFLFVFRNETD